VFRPPENVNAVLDHGEGREPPGWPPSATLHHGSVPTRRTGGQHSVAGDEGAYCTSRARAAWPLARMTGLPRGVVCDGALPLRSLWEPMTVSLIGIVERWTVVCFAGKTVLCDDRRWGRTSEFKIPAAPATDEGGGVAENYCRHRFGDETVR